MSELNTTHAQTKKELRVFGDTSATSTDLLMLCSPSLMPTDVTIPLGELITDCQHTHWRILPLMQSVITSEQLIDSIPPELTKFLAQKQLEGSMRELLKQTQLSHLIHTLSAHQIPILLLKGTAFSEWLYTKDAPRLSSDLDILVKPEHWDMTIAILSETMSKIPKPIEGVFDDLYEITLKPQSKQLSFEIDLHQHLCHPTMFDVDFDGIWSRSIIHPTFDNEYARIMSVNDALIHQALHSFKDAEYKTYNLVDTLFLIQKGIEEANDWAALIDTAQSQKADIALYFLLERLAEALSRATHNDTNKLIMSLMSDLNVSRFRKWLFNQIRMIEVTGEDKINKSIRYRLLQLGFHFFVSRKPLSILKLQCQYLIGKTLRKKSRK